MSFLSLQLCTNVHSLANVVFPLLILTWSMTVNSSRNALKRRTWALFMFFLLPGLLMASWQPVRLLSAIFSSVSIAEMGGVLFGLSIGSMSGIPLLSVVSETLWDA